MVNINEKNGNITWHLERRTLTGNIQQRELLAQVSVILYLRKETGWVR